MLVSCLEVTIAEQERETEERGWGKPMSKQKAQILWEGQ